MPSPSVRVVSLVLLPLLLAGCFGGCGPYYTATWQDPRVFQDLPRAAERAGVPLETSNAPEALALEARRLDPAWEHARITRLDHRPVEEGREERFTGAALTPEGVEVVATDDAAAVDLLRAFLANATLEWASMGEASRADAESRLVASRRPAASAWSDAGERTVAYRYTLDDAWTPAPALLEGASSKDAEGASLGHARIDLGDGWSALVAFPTRAIVVDGVEVRADAGGGVEVELGERPGMTADEAAGAVRSVMDDLALPMPYLDGDDVGAIVC